VGHEDGLRRDFELGNEPRFVAGVTMDALDDDGSPEFDRRYVEAARGPVREGSS
jgi:hypothetical protein